jgi:hypothetical protein
MEIVLPLQNERENQRSSFNNSKNQNFGTRKKASKSLKDWMKVVLKDI